MRAEYRKFVESVGAGELIVCPECKGSCVTADANMNESGMIEYGLARECHKCKGGYVRAGGM